MFFQLRADRNIHHKAQVGLFIIYMRGFLPLAGVPQAFQLQVQTLDIGFVNACVANQ